MAGARTAERNELILQNAHLTHAEIARLVHSETGLYVTPNAVNIVITRAKTAGDRRVLGKKSRRGRKGASPFNNWTPTGASPKTKPSPLSQPRASNENEKRDIAASALPPTAQLLFNIKGNRCRFPLRGERLNLIVCGAVVGGKGPYCPGCRDRAYLPRSG